jgi:hypothetical protein
MPVNSHVFGGDPCPGTSKYVEVHYACVNSDASNGLKSMTDSATTRPPLPPWLQKTAEIWNEEDDGGGGRGKEEGGEENNVVRKPILVQVSVVRWSTSQMIHWATGCQ